MEFIVKEEEQGMFIEQFLHHRTLAPLSLFFKLVREKRVRINKKLIKPRHIIFSRDHIKVFYVIEEKRKTAALEDLKIYEDYKKIFINKPVGICSQPGTKVINNLCDIIGDYLLIHRLDRETSGVMCLAKTPLDAKILSKALKKSEKYYLALLDGYLEKETIVDVNLKKMTLKTIWSDDGKEAISKFTPLAYHNNQTLCLVQIFTGRTHQIRVHSLYMNMPIVGDIKYEGPQDKRMYLHSLLLKIDDVCIHADLDEKFSKKLEEFNFSFKDLINKLMA